MKIHLIGIGGIGVSALAQYYLSKEHDVSGSDLVASELTDFLKEKGVKIKIGEHKAENISKDLNLVVYSPAVKTDNLELLKAKEYKLKTASYPEALGELTNKYYTIAVSGAHGKSTTTAMIALVLVKAGLDPTVVVGTKVKEFGNSNFRAGKSRFLVIEACEYDSSFLHYLPRVIVVTNVDKEHLDYFKTFKNVVKAFKDFILKLSSGDFLVFNKDDKYIPRIHPVKYREAVISPKAKLFNRVNNPKFKVKGYSIKQKEAIKLKKILKVPGMHNVSNALAALEVARILEIPDKVSFSALSDFKGTWRRFQIKEGSTGNKKITVVSDYGHHPNELLATLKAAREKYPKKRIWCVFQPHQHQRTYYLFRDFVKTLRQAQDDYFINKIIVTDIYDVAGREIKKINVGISSEKLVQKIHPVKFREAEISPKAKLFNGVNKKNVIYLPMNEIEKYIKENIKSGEVLIIMGAGDIYKLADKF